MNRTCIGCRATAPKRDLVRLVARSGEVEIDEAQTMPGRGAYLHPDQACLDQASRRRAFKRALRQDVQSRAIETNPVWS